MLNLDLDYIADRLAPIRRACLVAVPALLCLHLLIGAGSTRDRAVMVFMATFMMCAGFWGIRLILWLQVALHGMTRSVRRGCAFFFLFFTVSVLWGLVGAIVGSKVWAVYVALCLVYALGALVTYVRYRTVKPKWAKAI